MAYNDVASVTLGNIATTISSGIWSFDISQVSAVELLTIGSLFLGSYALGLTLRVAFKPSTYRFPVFATILLAMYGSFVWLGMYVSVSAAAVAFGSYFIMAGHLLERVFTKGSNCEISPAEQMALVRAALR